jgi:hypothetical protein
MHVRPATAARWASVAAIDAVRSSGVVLRNIVSARRDARRRSGVRFIGSPGVELVWASATRSPRIDSTAAATLD